jgi:threonine synthase
MTVALSNPHPGVLSRYRRLLPMTDDTPMLSLGEGDTPLVQSVAFGRELGCRLYFKLEGCNPTGSFKDRGMVMAVAKAVEAGSRAVVCASTGNTAASAAAYATRAGLQPIVILPESGIAIGKLAQAFIYGATVVSVRDTFDACLQLVRELGQKHPIAVVNSINPFRLEGQKTAAFEICDVLGDAPDFFALPVGNAGNITAYWRGFRQYVEEGGAMHTPRILGFQAAGAAPLVDGAPVSSPKTIASAIRIGDPASRDGALRARDESDGFIDSVTDDEILTAYRDLARLEGIFVEPASAAPLAGLRKLAREQRVNLSGQTVACVLTGNGLKDPDVAAQQTTDGDLRSVESDLAAIERRLGL